MPPLKADYSSVLFLGSTHFELWLHFEARQVLCWRQWVFRPGSSSQTPATAKNISGSMDSGNGLTAGLTFFQTSFPGALNISRRNWRVEDWSDAIKGGDKVLNSLSISQRHEIMVIALGSQNIHDTEAAVLVSMFQELLTLLHAKFPKCRIILLSILPRLPMSQKLDQRIKDTNALLKERLSSQDFAYVSFCDITHHFYRGQEVLKEVFQADRIQLNFQGYKILKHAIKRILLKSYQEKIIAEDSAV